MGLTFLTDCKPPGAGDGKHVTVVIYKANGPFEITYYHTTMHSVSCSHLYLHGISFKLRGHYFIAMPSSAPAQQARCVFILLGLSTSAAIEERLWFIDKCKAGVFSPQYGEGMYLVHRCMECLHALTTY